MKKLNREFGLEESEDPSLSDEKPVYKFKSFKD